MASIIKIELNLVPGAAPGGIMPRVRVSQGDAQDRILQFELYDGSEVADLTDVVSIFFGGQKPDGNGFTVLCTAQNNLVTGILTPQSTVLAGLIPCKLYLTTATGSVRSATFDMQIDPDPLNDAGTSDTDITAIVAAAGNYAAKAQQSAEDAAASAETAATAGATAGEAAAQEVVNNKLDKVGGDSTADIITFTSSDDATESGIIIPSGGEENVPALVTGATHAGLLGNLSKAVLNSRKLINTVKRIWTSVANTWASGAEYKAGNVVTYINGHTYICILDHTASSSITPLNATYWDDKTIGDMIYSLYENKDTIKELHTVYRSENESISNIMKRALMIVENLQSNIIPNVKIQFSSAIFNISRYDSNYIGASCVSYDVAGQLVLRSFVMTRSNHNIYGYSFFIVGGTNAVSSSNGATEMYPPEVPVKIFI
jgi:hypothetical protein